MTESLWSLRNKNDIYKIDKNVIIEIIVVVVIKIIIISNYQDQDHPGDPFQGKEPVQQDHYYHHLQNHHHHRHQDQHHHPYQEPVQQRPSLHSPPLGGPQEPQHESEV